MRHTALLLLVVSAWVSTAVSQGTIGLREVVSYEKQTYNAGAQNWDIRQDLQGRVYFANNEGLLSFDGIYWKLYPLPNKTIVRSIEFGADNRIYAGAQDEIGYFSPDKSGKLVYTSLKNLVPVADRKFADIWNIVSYGRSIFFRSDNKILRYTDNTIGVFRPFVDWLYMGRAGGKLIAEDVEKGLLVFKQGAWEPFI